MPIVGFMLFVAESHFSGKKKKMSNETFPRHKSGANNSF